MNPKEYEELHRHATEILDKCLFQKNMSPCAVPIHLVPKGNGLYQMCVDSRAVKKVTIKYGLPIPGLMIS